MFLQKNILFGVRKFLCLLFPRYKSWLDQMGFSCQVNYKRKDCAAGPQPLIREGGEW